MTNHVAKEKLCELYTNGNYFDGCLYIKWMLSVRNFLFLTISNEWNENKRH